MGFEHLEIGGRNQDYPDYRIGRNPINQKRLAGLQTNSCGKNTWRIMIIIKTIHITLMHRVARIRKNPRVAR